MNNDHISVCVCTFRRPELLRRLLDGVMAQSAEGFTFDVVIVDNDRERSAESVVRKIAATVSIAIAYDCEPEQNISLARNRAIRNASGNLVALIDDDECPRKTWLQDMHRVLRSGNAVGVLGPVEPEVPAEAPAWLRRAPFLHRDRHATGTPITSRDARTGNVLLYRSVFIDEGCWFDPAYGRTGGEDSDFFARQFRAGARYLWCDEAEVFELVPPERWTGSYYVKRRLLSGTITGQRLRGRKGGAARLIVSNLVMFVACLCGALPSLLLPKHLRVLVLQKLAYCCGVITAYFGMPLVKQRA